jgi:glutathione S-transferase
MKLYSYPTAPSARRARIFCAEKGISVAVENIDLRQGEHLADRYLRINGQGLIPTLQLDDGTTITENIAIAVYLDAQFPDPTLLGSTPLQCARVFQWNARVEFEGLLPLADSLRNSHPAFKGRALPGVVPYEQISELAARGTDRVQRFLHVLDTALQQQEFVAGSFFSFADITATALVDMLAMAKLNVPADLTRLRRWHEAVQTRPSYTA